MMSGMPPLDGLKVVDLTRVLAGPFCAMLLGDMGADVIKIEEPKEGDDARSWAPFVGPWSAYFVGVNRSKRSVGLDLKCPEGAANLRALLAQADVFIENFKPGSLDKLGFSYEAMRVLNPRLIYCSITGYGKTGPRRHQTGYDPIVQAESGFMSITGTPDGPPVRTGIATADYLAGLYAFGGILLALRARDRSGRGQHIDISLYDSVLSTLSMPAGVMQLTGREPQRLGNDHSSISPYEVLSCADGMLMIGCANSRLWQQLCDAIDRRDLIDDPRFKTNTDRVKNRPALKVEIEGAFSSYTVDSLVARLTEFGVPCGRVRTVSQALADPQVEPRQMFIPFDDPELDGFRVLGNPIKLSETPANLSRRPPKLGEHTEEVLRGLHQTSTK
jgi:formyl-CoA transferase